MSEAVGQRELDQIRELVDKARDPLDLIGGWVNQLEREIDKMRAKIEASANNEIERLQAERDSLAANESRRIETLKSNLLGSERRAEEIIALKDKRIAELEQQLNHDLHAEGRLAAIKVLSDALLRVEVERNDALARIAELEKGASCVTREPCPCCAGSDSDTNVVEIGPMCLCNLCGHAWTVRPAKAGA